MSCSSLFFLYIAELGICHKIHVWLQQRPQQQMYLFLITPSTLLNQVCVIVVAINLLIYWEGNTALCWCLLGRKYYTYCCILLGKNHSLTRLWHTIEKDIHINFVGWWVKLFTHNVVSQSFGLSIIQSVNPSIRQSVSQSVGQSINQSVMISQSVSHLVSQSVGQSVS